MERETKGYEERQGGRKRDKGKETGKKSTTGRLAVGHTDIHRVKELRVKTIRMNS